MKRVTCIGGGTGMFSLLSGLKEEKNIHISAVVSMMDSGGSTGKLRDEFGHLPPGDIRQCLVALSHAPQELRKLMQYRFPIGKLEGHSFGNLMLTALKGTIDGTPNDQEYGAIERMEEILAITGKVFPVTLDNCHLIAHLQDGTMVRGESNIDVPKHNTKIPIVKLSLDRPAHLFSKAKKALEGSDLIIIGPGDLYTSLLPNLIVSGMGQALARAQRNGAKIIFMLNTMTKNGETDGYTAYDFVRKIRDAIQPAKINKVIVNNGALSEEQREAYEEEHAYPVKNDLESNFIEANLISKESFARHDPEKTAKVIRKLL